MSVRGPTDDSSARMRHMAHALRGPIGILADLEADMAGADPEARALYAAAVQRLREVVAACDAWAREQP